jgi:hypothetical protein
MISPFGVFILTIFTAVIILSIQWKELRKAGSITLWLSIFLISISAALLVYVLTLIQVPHPMDGFISILEPFVPFKSN